MSPPAKDGTDEPTKAATLSYAEERPQIRADVAERIIAVTDRVDRPTAIFTGGQPGAGKSHSIVAPLEAEYASKGGIGVIDPDAIRPLFQQAEKEMVGGGKFSPEAYVASGTVAYEISIDVAKHQRHLLRDGTLADLKYPREEMMQLRTMGYGIEAHIAAVYQDLSHARTVVRGEREAVLSGTGFGRTVGREFHDNAVQGVANSAGQLWNSKLIDRMVLYDAQGARLLDASRQDDKWVDPQGKPHQGLGPKEELEKRQHQPSARDLVDAADTWLTARGLVHAPDRKVPAPEVTIAAVERETTQAFNKVIGSREAMTIASERKPLREALETHQERPLQAPAEAWRRSPAEAVKHWPEHQAMFAVAERAARACEQAKPTQAAAAREFMADKMARGQVMPEPAKTKQVQAERTAPAPAPAPAPARPRSRPDLER